MGGLVSGQEAQIGGHRLDGAVSTCGLMARRHRPEQLPARRRIRAQPAAAPRTARAKLVGYTAPAEGAAAAAQLSATATAARADAAGRARVALATALLNMPTWSGGQAEPPAPGDAEGIAAAQYEWLVATLPFIMPSRYFIELSAAGTPPGTPASTTRR
nr:hypothetical protein GCM10020092_037600 [Actinoplanes digitatis]